MKYNNDTTRGVTNIYLVLTDVNLLIPMVLLHLVLMVLWVMSLRSGNMIDMLLGTE